MLAMGVVLALFERTMSGKGQVIDAAMVDGANYVALPMWKWSQDDGHRYMPMRPDGHLDAPKSLLNMAPHWFDCYRCKDDPKKAGTVEYMSVQAILPPFYRALLKGLGLADAPGLPDQNDQSAFGWMKARFASIFLTRTRDDWAEHFYGTDACCVPVLTTQEAAVHPHAVERGSFAPSPEFPGKSEPVPAPRLSRTPGMLPRPRPIPAGDTRAVLRDFGFSAEEVSALLGKGAAMEPKPKL